MPVAKKLCLLYMFYIMFFVTLGQQSLAALAWLRLHGVRGKVNVYELTLHISKVNVSCHHRGLHTRRQSLSHKWLRV